MTRCAHWLRTNASKELPHSAIWVDTESDQTPIGEGRVKHTLRFGWSCHQYTWGARKWSPPDWARFTTPLAFWLWVESRTRPKTKTYIFAHNFSFDAPVLGTFSILPGRGWRLTRAIIECPPVILSWRRETTSLVLLDTLNWWRMPLEQLGKGIATEKLTMPDENASVEEWDRYCRQDVEVIRQAVHNWWRMIEENDLGGFAPTVAGQAMKAFRHRFMKTPILIDDDTRALTLARKAYYGGRVEIFFKGRIEKQVHCYDVNSMYPFVMKENVYPTILRMVALDATYDELTRWLDEYAVVAKVTLETDSPQYAYRMKEKVIFPVGCFVAYLTTPDLKMALKQGHLRSIEEVALYEAHPLFIDYVTEIYALRNEAKKRGDKATVWLLKWLLNSLYGKFAQKGNVWTTVGRVEEQRVEKWIEYDAVTGKVHSMRAFAGVLQEKKTDIESRESHPAIAAHVTAYARRLLWDLMEQAGRTNVLYCDTDSLYVTDEGAARLSSRVDEFELGSLKEEGVYKWLDIHCPKDYETEGKRVVKGIRKKARWVDENRAIHEQWSTLRGMVSLQQMESPIVTERVKTLTRIYDKGVVGKDGTVRPLTLSEG